MPVEPPIEMERAAERVGMHTSDLRVFEAVARLGNMSRAALALNTVQSNVTTHIRRLEEELGTPLFTRKARGVELTPAGRRLLPYAGRIERLLDDARRHALDDGTPQGSLVIGTLETTAALRLPDALAAFAAAYPAVDLALHTGTTCELVDQVLRDEVEGAFVCGPVSRPELSAEVIVQEELSVLSAPSRKSLSAAIGQQGLRIVVLRTGCSYRERLEGWLARNGVGQPRVLEFGTLEAVFSCVAAGLGITMLPRALLGQVWRDGRVAVHPLPLPDARVETLFIRRRDAYLSSALSTFLDVVRASAPRPMLTAAE